MADVTSSQHSTLNLNKIIFTYNEDEIEEWEVGVS